MPLGQRGGENSESRYAGCEVLRYTDDIEEVLSSSLAAGFDFILLPLTNPEYRPSKNAGLVPPYCGSDLVFSSSQWSSHIVGKISSWMNLDGDDDVARQDSELVLKQELSWASHLSIQACLLPTPRTPNCANYARCVNLALQNLTNIQLWLRLPLQTPEMEEAEATDNEDAAFMRRDPVSNRLINDSWEWWHTFRSLCEHHNLLGVALDITASLPSVSAIKRWIGEPLKAGILHTSAFLTNKKGYPCLSKRHQSLIMMLFNHSVQVILSGESFHSVSALEENGEVFQDGSSSDPLILYRDYLANLYRKLPPLTTQEQFELGYRDFLQAPLQPLMDNLEAQTYETFEKDEMKYTQYQHAVRAALLDRVCDAEASTKTTVLMVVGAGRGPLVRASLKAAEECGRKLRVYAVEKNPNAVVTLSRLIKMEGWDNIVELVSCDMRHWNAPEQADILVSELLGSFGDNELSPECLDGAQRFLKKDGISIPSSYTSYIVPITASKLYNDVKSYNDLAHFETAYVVKLHNAASLAVPQPVFTFSHPTDKPDNRRYKRLVFNFSPDTGSALVHGFGGYFDAVLYKDIHLGIEPSTATPGMFSWFSIFFPLRAPVYVPAGAMVELHFWRCVAPAKVWYEWSVTSPTVSPIHNPNGRSYWVGL